MKNKTINCSDGMSASGFIGGGGNGGGNKTEELKRFNYVADWMRDYGFDDYDQINMEDLENCLEDFKRDLEKEMRKHTEQIKKEAVEDFVKFARKEELKSALSDKDWKPWGIQAEWIIEQYLEKGQNERNKI